MNKTRANKLYNYLVNEFGLSKELILETVKTRVDDVLAKNLEPILNSNYLKKAILNHVTRIVKEGSKSNYIHIAEPFEFLVREAVNVAVKEELKNNYAIKVERVSDDKK